MKKLLLLLLSLLAGLGLLFWITKSIGWEDIGLAFLAFSGWDGLIILGLTFLMLAVGNWRWRSIVRKQGEDISFFAAFRLYLASFPIMIFAPIFLFAGETLRAYFLKEKHSVVFEKGMASVIVDRMVELTVYMSIIVPGVFLLFLSRGLPSDRLVFTLAVVLSIFAAGIALFYFKSHKKQSILKFFGRAFSGNIKDAEPLEVEEEIFAVLKPKELFFWKMVALSFLKCGITLVRAWFLIFSLGKSISFLSAVSVISFSYLALMIPIPTALGTHETFQTFVFNSLGLGASTAPVFTMVIRGAELAVALLGLVILFKIGAGIVSKIVSRKISYFLKIDQEL